MQTKVAMQRVSKWSTTLLWRFPAYSVLPRQSQSLSTKTTTVNQNRNDKEKEGEWNDAWETAWLPDDDDVSAVPAPWELESELNLDDPDPDAKAFVEDMNANWDHRRTNNHHHSNPNDDLKSQVKTEDYRLKKQRIHASLWTQQIQSLQEANLNLNHHHHIDNLLDSCSQIFDSSYGAGAGDDDNNLNLNQQVTDVTPPKTKPDGWETTSTTTTSNSDHASVWDMSQREEDILLQEFERRLAFSKFQIASFIKTHIFSRRRPIDGWKYMIEVIGPNARKGKGTVSRLPTLADPATQPFDTTPPTAAPLTSRKPRSPR